MRTRLAWRNLTHNKVRAVVALSGVAFAVVLIFMQLGFLGSVRKTATLLYGAIDFDIVMRSPSYLHFSDPRDFPMARLYLAESIPEVERVSPLYVMFNTWQHPRENSVRSILVLGSDPADDIFNVPEIRAQRGLLSTPERVLVDSMSRRDFGPKNGEKFGKEDIGVQTEIGGKPVEIVGVYPLGAGLAADGAVLMSRRGFEAMFGTWVEEQTNFGLVKLKPGANLEEALRKLRQIFPEDVVAYTREEALEFETRRWITDTAIGIVFQLGVAVAMVVGTAIVYQVLSSDISNHMAEYATLKAIGYTNMYLAKVVMQQAVLMAVFGFLPGWAISEVLYQITSYWANMPISNTLARIGTVFLMTLAMCTVSGMGALNKVRTAEPADLF